MSLYCSRLSLPRRSERGVQKLCIVIGRDITHASVTSFSSHTSEAKGLKFYCIALNLKISASRQNIKNLISNFGAIHMWGLCMPTFRLLASLGGEWGDRHTCGVTPDPCTNFLNFPLRFAISETPWQLNSCWFRDPYDFICPACRKASTLYLSSLRMEQINRINSRIEFSILLKWIT